MMPDISSQDDFLTVSELSRQWRVSEGHLYNLIKRDELRAVRIGERLVVKRADARLFIESHATAQAA
jgi:excisionase family DNA binding protein